MDGDVAGWRSQDVHIMATIRKLQSGRYNVQVRREGHPPVSATFGTRTEAKASATKIEDDINQGRHYGFSRVRTVADAIDAFKNAATTTIKTIDDRNRHLAWWHETFGHRKLLHFTADAVEQGRVTAGSRRSPKYRHV
jgi:hypothetical protein